MVLLEVLRSKKSTFKLFVPHHQGIISVLKKMFYWSTVQCTIISNSSSKNYNPSLTETLHLGNGIITVSTLIFLKRWSKIPKIFNQVLDINIFKLILNQPESPIEWSLLVLTHCGDLLSCPDFLYSIMSSLITHRTSICRPYSHSHLASRNKYFCQQICFTF